MRRALCVVLAAVAVAAAGLAAQTTKPTQLELRKQTFDIVWSRVKERFFDPTFHGVDWDAVKVKYEPRVGAVKSEDEFYALLNEMIGELKESHFAVIPPSVYLAEDHAGKSSGEADAGMRVQVVEGRPTIVAVDPGRPAAKAGLKPGFIVLQVGKTKIDEIQARIATRRERAIMRSYHLSAVVHSLTTGHAGNPLTVKVLDGLDRPRTVTLRLAACKGKPFKFGELPKLYGFMESKRLPGGIGYVKFNIFMMGLLAPLQKALASFAGEKAIIIDLRGNPGGFGAMAVPIAHFFVGKDMDLGVMKMRDSQPKMHVFGNDKPFKGPLVFLTDEGTGSTSELLAGGMQEWGRARTVGGPSLGAVLPSVFEKLPDGARFQYAIADFKTPKGVLLEGRGVLPDVPVALTRKALLAGKDPILEKAVAVVLKSAAARKQLRAK